MRQDSGRLVADVIKVDSTYPSDIIRRFVDEAKYRTNGEIEITAHPSSAPAKPMEQFDLVKRGAIDLGFSVGWMHARKILEGMLEFSGRF